MQRPSSGSWREGAEWCPPDKWWGLLWRQWDAQRPTRKGCPNRPVEFKRELAVAACAPGVSVAKLALAHGLNTNLLFKWRRQYRAGQFGVPDPAHAVTLRSEPSTLPSVSPPSPIRLLPVVEVATGVGVGETTGPELACIEVVFACATVRICGVAGERGSAGGAELPGALPMIGLPLGTRVWIGAGVTDMRKGMDGLAALVQTALGERPFSGDVFVFRGRARRPAQTAVVER